MGPFESKHAKHNGQSYTTSNRKKKSFLSRLGKRLFKRSTSSCKQNRKRSSVSKHSNKKSHRSHLYGQRHNDSISHRKINNEKTRNRKQKSRIKKQSNKLTKRSRKTESRKLTRTPSKAYSIASSSTIQKMSGNKAQKDRWTKKGKVTVNYPSFRKALQSRRRISSWSSSSRQSVRSARRRIKAFFSRPMRDASVQKFVEKIKKRNELRKGNTFKKEISEVPLRSADEKFPFRHRVQRYESEMIEESDKITTLKKPISRVINKDNEGKLFDEDGLPFWNKLSKVQKDSEKNFEEATDEDLPMDSEVLIEVQAGLRKLVKMPKIRIVMDPYAPLDYLESRDKIFFTSEVVFSNTVRSMVNLNDEISNEELISKRSRELGKISVEEPIKMTRYDQNNPLIHDQVPI